MKRILLILAVLVAVMMQPADEAKAESEMPPQYCGKDIHYDFSAEDGYWRSEFLWSTHKLSFDPRGTPMTFTYHYVKSEKYRVDPFTFEVDKLDKVVDYHLCYINDNPVTYI